MKSIAPSLRLNIAFDKKIKKSFKKCLTTVFQSAKIHAGGIYKQRVVFDDVDGEANGGEFRSVDMSIKDLDSKQIKKGGDWYEGEYELSTKVQMKKK